MIRLVLIIAFASKANKTLMIYTKYNKMNDLNRVLQLVHFIINHNSFCVFLALKSTFHGLTSLNHRSKLTTLFGKREVIIQQQLVSTEIISYLLFRLCIFFECDGKILKLLEFIFWLVKWNHKKIAKHLLIPIYLRVSWLFSLFDVESNKLFTWRKGNWRTQEVQ